MKYSEEIEKAMLMLAEHPKTIFLGQSVAYPGNVIYKNLSKIPNSKKLELPVFEDTQMGMSIGLAMEGFIPISIFPRYNFLLCAMSQLINHLDKMPVFAKRTPKVIIKTMVGSIKPLHPGEQHCSNFTTGFKEMLNTIEIVDLTTADQIIPAYTKALNNNCSTLLVEYGDLYNQ